MSDYAVFTCHGIREFQFTFAFTFIHPLQKWYSSHNCQFFLHIVFIGECYLPEKYRDTFNISSDMILFLINSLIVFTVQIKCYDIGDQLCVSTLYNHPSFLLHNKGKSYIGSRHIDIFFVLVPLVKNNCRPRLLQLCISFQRITQYLYIIAELLQQYIAQISYVIKRLSSGK